MSADPLRSEPRVIARQSWLFLSASKSFQFVSDEMCRYRAFRLARKSPKFDQVFSLVPAHLSFDSSKSSNIRKVVEQLFGDLISLLRYSMKMQKTSIQNC
jgi:hypothetical protein